MRCLAATFPGMAENRCTYRGGRIVHGLRQCSSSETSRFMVEERRGAEASQALETLRGSVTAILGSSEHRSPYRARHRIFHLSQSDDGKNRMRRCDSRDVAGRSKNVARLSRRIRNDSVVSADMGRFVHEYSYASWIKPCEGSVRDERTCCHPWKVRSAKRMSNYSWLLLTLLQLLASTTQVETGEAACRTRKSTDRKKLGGVLSETRAAGKGSCLRLFRCIDVHGGCISAERTFSRSYPRASNTSRRRFLVNETMMVRSCRGAVNRLP